MNAQIEDPLVANPVVAASSFVAGVGKFVPERIVPNSYFASYLETSDEWIRDRSGIAERRWAAPEDRMSDLAEPAARDAIRSAGLVPSQIDGIVFATVTPDFTFPSTACVMQQRLGIPGCVAFDVNAVCSGFLYALTLADGLIRSGQSKHVLVIGADMFSRIIDPNDRGTCVLFGDGAGAMVLSAVEGRPSETRTFGGPVQTGSSLSLQGLYGTELHADGTQGDILKAPLGTGCPATAESLSLGKHYVTMQGREVFKLAVRGLVEVNKSIVEKVGLTLADVDHFVSHQANSRILLSVAKQLDIPESKVPMNLQRYGNTSAASVPLLFAECVEQGTIKRGDLCVLSAFGAGVTWGAAVLRY